MTIETFGSKLIIGLILSVLIYALSAPFRSFIDEQFGRKI